MILDTTEKVVRSLLDMYKKDLQDAMDYPSQEFKFNVITSDGICKALFLSSIPERPRKKLELEILKRVRSKGRYLCEVPTRCETTDELIYAYQARISLLEEILIEVTPVDEEEELGTFEKFNNILY